MRPYWQLRGKKKLSNEGYFGYEESALCDALVRAVLYWATLNCYVVYGWRVHWDWLVTFIHVGQMLLKFFKKWHQEYLKFHYFAAQDSDPSIS